MPLTDVAIRNAKPRSKAYKVFDAKGLFLWIQPNGSKWWRYAYRFDGKQNMLALGTYPEITLAEAREAHAEAHKLVVKGIDPNEAKKAKRRERQLNEKNTFESVARDWHETKCHTLQPRYAGFVLRRLEADVFPKLGERPIRDITAPELLSVIKRIEKRGALEMAQRALKVCGQIFMYGIATGKADRNPANDLQGALKQSANRGVVSASSQITRPSGNSKSLHFSVLFGV